MPNPRNTLKFDGIIEPYVTFEVDGSDIVFDATKENGSASVGLAVMLKGGSDDRKVRLVGDGDPVYGKLIKVEADGKCVVQKRGFVTLPGGESATLTVGAKVIGDLGPSSARGFVQALAETVSGSYTQAELQNAFKAAKTRGIIIENDTTTAVVVDLG